MNYTAYLLAPLFLFSFARASDKDVLAEIAASGKKQPRKRTLMIRKPFLLRPLSEQLSKKIEFQQLCLPILPKVAWKHIRDYTDHSQVIGYIKTQMTSPITSMVYISLDTDHDNGEFVFDFAHKPKNIKSATFNMHKNQLITKHFSHPEMEGHLYIPQTSRTLMATLTAQKLDQNNKKNPLIHQLLTLEEDTMPAITHFFNRAIEYSLPDPLGQHRG